MSETRWRHHAERLLAAHALRGADPEALVRLLARCPERRLKTGDLLCRQGDPGDDLFFLLEGRLRVLKKDHEGHEREIGMWFAPALVGMLALAEGAPRSATCMAAAPTTLAVVEGATVRKLLNEPSPEAAHLRWLLLSGMTDALAKVREGVRALLAAEGDPHSALVELHALVEGAAAGDGAAGL